MQEMKAQMEPVQKALLGILENVIKSCDEAKIPYYLVEGTCLGAVRHKGFIPWDDDIDIAIPEECVDRFYALQKGLPPNLKIMGGKDIDENLRVIDLNVDIKRMGCNNDKEDKMSHPWIDVMVLFGFPGNSMMQKIHYSRMWYHHQMFKLSDWSHISNRKRGWLARNVIKAGKAIRVDKLINGRRHLVKLHNIGVKYSITNSEYVINFLTWYGKKEIMPKRIYGDGTVVPFENISAKVPTGYDEYLTRLYGDYMQLPPENERTGKHNITIISQ